MKTYWRMIGGVVALFLIVVMVIAVNFFSSSETKPIVETETIADVKDTVQVEKEDRRARQSQKQKMQRDVQQAFEPTGFEWLNAAETRELNLRPKGLMPYFHNKYDKILVDSLQQRRPKIDGQMSRLREDKARAEKARELFLRRPPDLPEKSYSVANRRMLFQHPMPSNEAIIELLPELLARHNWQQSVTGKETSKQYPQTSEANKTMIELLQKQLGAQGKTAGGQIPSQEPINSQTNKAIELLRKRYQEQQKNGNVADEEKASR